MLETETRVRNEGPPQAAAGEPMRNPRTRIALGAVAVLAVCAVGYAMFANGAGGARAAPLSQASRQFDAQRAFTYLETICAIGPRPTGSTGMQRQQELLAEHFEALGGKVGWQRFRMRHP